MDARLLELAKVTVGQKFRLTPLQARRLNGSTASELRADATRMRKELGLPPLEEQGRFRRAQVIDLNTAIRERQVERDDRRDHG
jgi:hypothetical protein